MDDSCIFCRIVKGELPCTRIYEDDHVFAFLDINPIAKGHLLVIPKGHYATLVDIPEDCNARFAPVLAKLGKALMTATGAAGFNCLQNNFAAAGQIVFHSHWHIIPRFEDDGLKHWPHNENIDASAMQAVAEAIRSAI